MKKLIRVEYDEYEEDAELMEKRVLEFVNGPDASKTEALTIGNWGEAWEESPARILNLLIEHKDKLSNLTTLFVGEMNYEECEISWINQCDYSELLTAYPKLETLKVQGSEGLTLGSIKHDSLKKLIIICGGLDKSVIQQIANAKLPALEHLELYLGVEDYGFDGDLEDVKPFMEKGRFPKLKYLGLKNSQIADEIALAIASAPVLEQIEVLDMSMGTLTEKGAKALIASEQIKQLKYLDLHYHYIKDKTVREALNQLGISVDLSDLQDDDDDDWRYPAVTE